MKIPASKLLLLLFAAALLQLPLASLAKDSQPANQPQRPKVGLALGGGGTRGAAHLGVLKVLEEEHVPIDFITGTSIGSIVGGIYAEGVPIAKIEELMNKKLIYKNYITMPLALRMACVPITAFPRAIGIHPLVGLYRGDKFANFFDKILPTNHRNIEQCNIPFEAVATNMQTGQAYVFKKGPLGKALQASAAIPGLKKPVLVDGCLLADGWLAGNLPIKQARDMGADVVICVDIDGPVQNMPKDKFHRVRAFENNTLTLTLCKLDREDRKLADVVIAPDVGNVQVLSNNLKDADKAEAAGEEAARQAMPQIRKILDMPKAELADGPMPSF